MERDARPALWRLVHALRHGSDVSAVMLRVLDDAEQAAARIDWGGGGIVYASASNAPGLLTVEHLHHNLVASPATMIVGAGFEGLGTVGIELSAAAASVDHTMIPSVEGVHSRKILNSSSRDDTKFFFDSQSTKLQLVSADDVLSWRLPPPLSNDPCDRKVNQIAAAIRRLADKISEQMENRCFLWERMQNPNVDLPWGLGCRGTWNGHIQQMVEHQQSLANYLRQFDAARPDGTDSRCPDYDNVKQTAESWLAIDVRAILPNSEAQRRGVPQPTLPQQLHFRYREPAWWERFFHMFMPIM